MPKQEANWKIPWAWQRLWERVQREAFLSFSLRPNVILPYLAWPPDLQQGKQLQEAASPKPPFASYFLLGKEEGSILTVARDRHIYF
jgi:hypothetical protein